MPKRDLFQVILMIGSFLTFCALFFYFGIGVPQQHSYSHRPPFIIYAALCTFLSALVYMRLRSLIAAHQTRQRKKEYLLNRADVSEEHLLDKETVSEETNSASMTIRQKLRE